MKGYLLDTGVALMAGSKPELLSPAVRRAIERGPAFLSVIAYWEVMVKSMKGTLDVGEPGQWFDQTLGALSLHVLLYRPDHVAAIYRLAPIHQDPFDRAMIAQATAEQLTLLTTDATIAKYAHSDFRILR